MKRIIVFTTIFTIFLKYSNLYSQTVDLNQGYVEQKEYYVTLPYQEIKNKVLIEVSINNKKRKFIIDTGAPTAISEALYNELQLKTVEQVTLADESGTKGKANLVVLPIIELMGVTFKDNPAIVNNEKMLFSCFGADGLIGSNLLRNSTIQFNSKEKTVTITNLPNQLKLKKKFSSEMELTTVQSNPNIKIKLKKDNITVTEKLLFDTGDDTFYNLSIDIYNKIKGKNFDVFDSIAHNNGSYSIGFYGAAEMQNNYLLNIRKIEINKISFNNVTTETTHSSTSRIGAEIFKYGKITLDYANKFFYFEPFDQVTEFDLREKTWAIDQNFIDNKVVVGIIWDKSLESKINLGDEILKFDETSYQDIDFCTILLDESKSAKEKVVVVLKDIKTGAIKKVEISKI